MIRYITRNGSTLWVRKIPTKGAITKGKSHANRPKDSHGENQKKQKKPSGGGKSQGVNQGKKTKKLFPLIKTACMKVKGHEKDSTKPSGEGGGNGKRKIVRGGGRAAEVSKARKKTDERP